MIHKRKQRLLLILILLLAISAITGLILYALRQNIDLYYTPEQISGLTAIPTYRIRIGGMVQKDSVTHLADLQVKFIVTDFKHDLPILYQGILPDLFKEGQGVVALGKFNSHNVFIAEQILAKHDENYMPDYAA